MNNTVERWNTRDAGLGVLFLAFGLMILGLDLLLVLGQGFGALGLFLYVTGIGGLVLGPLFILIGANAIVRGLRRS